jgi:dolichyl-phosphate beta-glucosyltransferase
MIAIVIPCFNEEKRFNLDYWEKLLQSQNSSQWLFVNDGSTDATLEILQSLNNINVEILNIDKNVGKGEAIRIGFLHLAKKTNPPSLLGFIDCDGAFEIQDIEHMIELSTQLIDQEFKYDMFLPSRVSLAGRFIKRSKLRHYLGRIIVSYLCLGWNSAPYDTQCGFKIFKLDNNFKKVIASNFQSRWFFDIEIILYLIKLGSNRIWEEPLNYWKDISGSKINFYQYYSIARDIFYIKRFIRHSIRSGLN